MRQDALPPVVRRRSVYLSIQVERQQDPQKIVVTKLIPQSLRYEREPDILGEDGIL